MSEPDSDMPMTLELLDREFKITMINMLKVLIDKVNSTKEQMEKISREMNILRKNQKEMWKIKNTVTEMKNAFDGPISKLNTAKERISELEDISIETSKTEK